MVMASTGHTFTHLVQPMQATSHFFLATAPLSSDWHKTRTLFFKGRMLIISLGHALIHFPQPVHLFSRITGIFPSYHLIASKGQTLKQSPIIKQAFLHAIGPRATSAASAQLFTPV